MTVGNISVGGSTTPSVTYTGTLANITYSANVWNTNYSAAYGPNVTWTLAQPPTDTIFNTDVKINGKLIVEGQDLSLLMKGIADRLAVVADPPSPEKLEKYYALKEAYEHYRLLEKLINDPD